VVLAAVLHLVPDKLDPAGIVARFAEPPERRHPQPTR